MALAPSTPTSLSLKINSDKLSMVLDFAIAMAPLSVTLFLKRFNAVTNFMCSHSSNALSPLSPISLNSRNTAVTPLILSDSMILIRSSSSNSFSLRSSSLFSEFKPCSIIFSISFTSSSSIAALPTFLLTPVKLIKHLILFKLNLL